MEGPDTQGTNSDGIPIRSMYVVHEHKGLDCSHDGRTRQEFADDCDINVLLARYEKSGQFSHFNSQEPAYLDVSNVPDLQASLTYLEEAKRAFMSLPATVRKEFDNDPVEFVKFAQDEANVDKMREWKLAKPLPEEPLPMKVEVVNPPQEPSVKPQ